jgi:LysR family glycine cleavage system transcriptional activator
MKRPRLNALRTFESAGRHLSFSLAGEELGISQAAVSQQIRQLEDYLNARLFVRRNRGLSLTALGEAYHLAVHEAIDRLDTITGQLFPDTRDRVVTVQCTPSVATLWLVPRLASLQAEHPGIDLRVATLGTATKPLHPATCDLEILTLDPVEAGPDCHPLMTVRIAPVCAPDLLADSRILQPAEVMRLNLLHVLGYRDDWHRWFQRVGLSDRKVPRGASFDGSLMALEAAMNGDGIMLGRRPFIDQHLKSGALVMPFGDEHTLAAEYYLRITEPSRRNRDVAAVTGWLLGMAGTPCP